MVSSHTNLLFFWTINGLGKLGTIGCDLLGKVEGIQSESHRVDVLLIAAASAIYMMDFGTGIAEVCKLIP
jgi:hypothetical protein